MLDHVLPAAPVVHDGEAAARHGLEADARPVLRRVGGLQDEVALAVEVLWGRGVGVRVQLYPWGGFADFFFAPFVIAQEECLFRYGGGDAFVDAQGVACVFVGEAREMRPQQKVSDGRLSM